MKMLTVAETAELCGITPEAVYGWIRRGWITPTTDNTIDGRVYLLRADEAEEVQHQEAREVVPHRRLPINSGANYGALSGFSASASTSWLTIGIS